MCTNEILTNQTMRDDLLQALDIKNIQNNISLINKVCTGVKEEQKKKARFEYKLEHDQSETSIDESDKETKQSRTRNL